MILGWSLLMKSIPKGCWMNCIKTYGSHAYVVPSWAYGNFIKYLDTIKRQTAGAIDYRMLFLTAPLSLPIRICSYSTAKRNHSTITADTYGTKMD